MAFSTPISGGEPAPGAFEVFARWRLRFQIPSCADTVSSCFCLFSSTKIGSWSNTEVASKSGLWPTFLLWDRAATVAWFDDNVRRRINDIAGRVASSEGMEVVDVEIRGGAGNRIVRLYLDKPAGISHSDCELVSRQVSAILDVEDLLPGRYVLEVSSPGVDRKLVKLADYERFSGKKARVRLRRPVGGRKQFTGQLQGCDKSEVILRIGSESDIRFRFDDIESARLVVEI